MPTMGEISSEGILLVGGGRAILLQIAVPAIGHGVANHSDFTSDPLRRLHGTLSYVYALANGTEADRAAVRRAVNRAHGPVRGSGQPAYNAMDPALQLWVAATLYETAIAMHERVFGALDDESADEIYREYAVLGTALQMPPELWPADRAAFRSYWDAQVAALSVDAATAGVQKELFYPSAVPFGIRLIMPLVRFVTVGLLPASVRELYGLPWTAAQERRFGRTMRVVAAVYRTLPRGIRQYPQRHYLARIRTPH